MCTLSGMSTNSNTTYFQAVPTQKHCREQVQRKPNYLAAEESFQGTPSTHRLLRQTCSEESRASLRKKRVQKVHAPRANQATAMDHAVHVLRGLAAICVTNVPFYQWPHWHGAESRMLIRGSVSILQSYGRLLGEALKLGVNLSGIIAPKTRLFAG